ncbi:protein NDRG3 isoform X1 [Strongylocentrotus purpuratus]|uniref:Protein NDRG3 n=1 Tax=Strongylocentrotus purpuratus TaxID=7668 RepID=A0A7M7NS16_STRPU|nr:protein NDRG3 isoform X1 [Strongylocentrotus purpuratus]
MELQVQNEREREKMSYSKLDADEGEMDPVNDMTEKMSYAKLEDGGEEGGKGDGGKNGQPLRAKSFDGFEDPSQPLLLSGNNTSVNYELDFVETEWGNILVAIQGDRTKPAILTYHDLGLNHVSCFQGFFNFPDMQPILKHFCVYHINAPGQEQGAAQLPENFEYPDMDHLAETLISVLNHFRLKKFIGFGVGSGANILTRFELAHPEYIEALILVNCVSTQSTWTEWMQQKLSAYYLRKNGMTNYTQEYLLWHYFGKSTMETHHELVALFRENLAKNVNAFNLSLFVNSYIRRTDLNIRRELDPFKQKNLRGVKAHSMLIVGANSPHVNDSVEMNARMDPARSQWMKMSDCGGMILEEQPAKLAEAIRLFLQGQGYVDLLKVRLNRPARSMEPPAPTSKTGAPEPVMV